MRTRIILLMFPAVAGTVLGDGAFRVRPYLQNPAQDAMTVIWFSEAATTGRVAYGRNGTWDTVSTEPAPAAALDYHSTEWPKFPGDVPPSLPFLHRARLTGLDPGASYTYVATQDGESVTNTFRTAPSPDAAVRFIVYADSETEPESTGSHTVWPEPGGDASRRYVVDQTRGYQENLLAIAARNPDFIVIVGDLVESGGEQRDWDEFWRHAAGSLGDLAGRCPILPSLGNHEYYGGTRGGYAQPASEESVAKYLAYFELLPNGAANPDHEGRYYRADYGPVTLLVLDGCNGDDADPLRDTSAYLSTASGCAAPDFNPGTPQYAWLESQLAAAQTRSAFIFVAVHHAPYSVGPHGLAGEEQSGVPLRVLTPLFCRYGVDALFVGHDEMYEHSAVAGEEEHPGGVTRAHTLHVFDVGIGGDGLRGPENGVTNDKQVFLAHNDAPETWEGARLVQGGKHYGHVEVNVRVNAEGRWEAVLTPVHVFPLMGESGTATGFERRTYADEVVLTGAAASSQGSGTAMATY